MKRVIVQILLTTFAVTAVNVSAKSVFVGHLADYTGPTSFIGVDYGQGVRDALDYINATGGIKGTKLDSETYDYAYKVPQAISKYKAWRSRKKMTAMQGWGTGDTEALISFVARDKVPVFSASYSGHLTDPTGVNPNTKKPAPYNFFYGPSYSDACRALVQWAASDWKAKGGKGKPKFVHAGANHPYPEAPRKACGEYAEELGFDIVPHVVVSMKPEDFKAQCLSIKNAGANYTYMGNLGGSVVSLLKSCNTVGVQTQWMSNIWAGDKKTLEAIGTNAKNYVFPAASAFWTDKEKGMDLLRRISKQSDPTGKVYRVHHYIRGVCSAFYMKEAMEWAADNGGIKGANIKQGMYQKKNWVPKGLEGVCLPSTWSARDHRGSINVNIYQGNVIDGKAVIERIDQVGLPRRDDWLGY